ncbi:MAG: GMC family oxidoreductase [Vicinamibacterales bacterium]|jgi:choline dehydrogenase-like flavoprotein|nr:GMC family oxidoreductase [Vicinamibacterales bacterium]MDP6607902.1 GMC family oxidoreductase [Vicinamibacterales bacterium]HAK56402.1 GMC family oxidoreductase [Acidobacteriota bacterium]|tara:strand:+ start:1700 stop:3388 length:1689 start_codon:yes stop_codon:yes gene_type:complete
MQVIRSPRVYDVCVVGSGAGGGMAAKVLTEAGAEVVLLEAGPMWDTAQDSQMLAWPYESPRRGAGTDRPFGEFDACLGGWELDGEPYTVGTGERFDWFRARMLGGRTNHWGRISLRYGPDDFRRRSLDGLGADWPITYNELKPFYDKLDRLVGLFGSEEGLPNEPDGVFQPPPRPRCYELLMQQSCDRLGITCIPSRMSILTQPLNGRSPCHYCGQCGRGCRTASNFSSPTVLLPPALATGRLTLLTGAMAREVTAGPDGLATGVSYVDTTSGREHQVRARVVVLAASACESARLLLNSTSTRFPDGFANSSGAVGRYLTDSTGASASGFIPSLMDGVPHNEDGSGMHVYMPWWLDNVALDFPRGYHIEPGGGRRMPGFGVLGGIERYPSGGGWGRGLKADYRRYYGAVVGFAGRGEMIPNAESYCEIDPGVVDRWGIPVLRFRFQWSDHERRQARHMQHTFRGIIDDMGGTPLTPEPAPGGEFGLEPGGRIIHEAGVTRMGDSADSSVLNAQCQAHDVRNLFVADGGPFVSQADKNLTWTIMALAMRTSEYIADARNRGEL